VSSETEETKLAGEILFFGSKDQFSLQLPLAAHPSASDSAIGWHCAL